MTLQDSVQPQRNNYAQKLSEWKEADIEYTQYLERNGYLAASPTVFPTIQSIEEGEALRKRRDEAWEQVIQAQRDLL